MRLQHRASDDMAFTERGWRIAPSGEIFDDHGGLIAGDVKARLQSLTMSERAKRFNRALGCDTNAGAEQAKQWERDRLAQEDHVKHFGR